MIRFWGSARLRLVHFHWIYVSFGGVRLGFAMDWIPASGLIPASLPFGGATVKCASSRRAGRDRSHGQPAKRIDRNPSKPRICGAAYELIQGGAGQRLRTVSPSLVILIARTSATDPRINVRRSFHHGRQTHIPSAIFAVPSSSNTSRTGSEGHTVSEPLGLLASNSK